MDYDVLNSWIVFATVMAFLTAFISGLRGQKAKEHWWIWILFPVWFPIILTILLLNKQDKYGIKVLVKEMIAP